jgi:hypothetical protein
VVCRAIVVGASVVMLFVLIENETEKGKLIAQLLNQARKSRISIVGYEDYSVLLPGALLTRGNDTLGSVSLR